MKVPRFSLALQQPLSSQLIEKAICQAGVVQLLVIVLMPGFNPDTTVPLPCKTLQVQPKWEHAHGNKNMSNSTVRVGTARPVLRVLHLVLQQLLFRQLREGLHLIIGDAHPPAQFVDVAVVQVVQQLLGVLRGEEA